MKQGKGILDMLVLFLQLFCECENKIKTNIFKTNLSDVEGKRLSKMENRPR